MSIRIALAGLALAAAGLLAVPAAAQTPVDFTSFNTACMGAGDFLLSGVPEGVDEKDVLVPLCGCMSVEFKDFPQADVDMLASDLRGESTDDTKKAYGDYDTLAGRAQAGFTKCAAADEVVKAMTPADAPAAPAVQ
jgi:hypothetical protein